MCTQSPPKGQKILTKEDFIIPEGWKPDTPSLLRIIELRKKIVGTVGPDLVREILEAEGITPKGDLARENRDRR